MEKIHEKVYAYESTKTYKSCFHVNFPFSAYFYLLLHHNGKGSIPYPHSLISNDFQH